MPLLSERDEFTTDSLERRLMQGDITLRQDGRADLHNYPFCLPCDSSSVRQ